MKSLTGYGLILGLLATFSNQLQAQSPTITGRVIDAETKNPVADVNITVAGKEVKTITNFKGFFQIDAKEKDILMVAHESYQSKDVLVTAAKAVQISIRKKLELPYEGGNEAFYKFVGTNVHYPKEARQDQRDGMVYVSFQVDTTGAVKSINIVKDIGKGCGNEIVRILKMMPSKWMVSEPTTFIFPVTFRFEDKHFTPLTEAELPDGKLMTELIVTGYEINRR